MKSLQFSIILIGIVICGAGATAQEVHSVAVDTVKGLIEYNGQTYLEVGRKSTVEIRLTNQGTPGCKFAPAMTFIIESPDGATWEASNLIFPVMYSTVPWWLPDKSFDNGIFSSYYSQSFSWDGVGSDTIGFAGIAGADDTALFEGFDYVAIELEITPSPDSYGMTICIDYGGPRDDGFDEGWNPLALSFWEPCTSGTVHPEWGGPYCFEVLDFQSVCCGINHSGMTGNTDCDELGLCNLADITRLIDRIYISHQPLCCELNGNVNGDENGLINLGDVTELIDHVYVNHDPTSACQ